MKVILLIIKKFLASSKDQKYISKLSFFSYVLVGLGIAVPILVLSVTNGFQEIVEKRIINYDFHLQAFFPELVDQSNLKKNDEQLKLIPFYEDKCLLKSRGATKVSQIRAYYPQDYDKLAWTGSSKLLAGVLKPSAGGIVLAESLAANLRISVGDELQLTVIDNSMGQNQFSLQKFRVDGIVSLGYAPYDITVSFILKSDADPLFLLSENTVNKVGFEIQGKNYGSRSFDFEKKLRQDYPEAIIYNTFGNRVFKDFKEEKKSLTIAMFIIMFIAFVAILITINVVLADKYRDIGLLKVLGINQSMMMNVFLGQGIWIAMIGVIGGFFLGSVVVVNLDELIRLVELMVNNFLFLLDLSGVVSIPIFYKFQIMPEDVFYLSSLPYKLQWQDFIFQGIGAFIFALIASFSPSLKAIHAHPSEILRNE